MKKVNALIMSLGLCTLIAGCTPTVQDSSEGLFERNTNEAASDDSAREATKQSVVIREENNSEDTAANENAEEQTGDEDTQTEGVVAQSGSEILDKVIAGEGKISFSFYKENILDKVKLTSYMEDVLQHVDADKEYTLSELNQEFDSIFHDENNYFNDSPITKEEYAFLDCGQDGTKELALQITAPFVEGNSVGTFILKEIDGKAQVVYAFATWSRSETEINEYGLISGGGSNGASNHGWDMAYIDADGKYNFGYYEEQELDFDSFAYFKEHDDYDASSLDGVLCTYDLRLEEYYENYAGPEYYTYEVLEKDTYEPTDVPDLYTDSEYKKIMDCFHGYDIVSMDEYKKIKKDKLESIGVTDEISGGKDLQFTEIDPAIAGIDAAGTGASETGEDSSESDTPVSLNDGTIQSEIAMLEQKYQEYENMDWAIMDQSQMNNTTAEMFNLWDVELNSLWSRLTETVTPKKKEELLQDQRAWIKKKEAAIKDAGDEAGGGSMQPQLENGTACIYTRERVYYLAGILAEEQGESFTIPSEVVESFKKLESDRD